MTKHNSHVSGIIYKIANLATYSLISIIIKLSLMHDVHTFQILFLLNISAATLTSGFFIFKRQSPVRKIELNTFSIMRSVSYVFGGIFWVMCLKYIPINEATALSYITPLMTALLGVITLKERLCKHVIFSLILGILGMYIMLQPFQSTLLWSGILLAIASSIMWAAHDTIIKFQTNSNTHWTTQAHTIFVVVSIILMPLAVYHWTTIHPKYLFLCLLLGAMTLLNMFFLITAISKSNLVSLAPISFLRLVFTAAMAYGIFNEVLTYKEVLGVTIVLFSTSLMVRNAKKIDGGSGKS